jgi:hypothetical protein
MTRNSASAQGIQWYESLWLQLCLLSLPPWVKRAKKGVDEDGPQRAGFSAHSRANSLSQQRSRANTMSSLLRSARGGINDDEDRDASDVSEDSRSRGRSVTFAGPGTAETQDSAAAAASAANGESVADGARDVIDEANARPRCVRRSLASSLARAVRARSPPPPWPTECGTRGFVRGCRGTPTCRPWRT